MPAEMLMAAVLCLLLSRSPAMPQDRGGHVSTVLAPCWAWHPLPDNGARALGQITSTSVLTQEASEKGTVSLFPQHSCG